MIKQRNDKLTKEEELELGRRIQEWQKVEAQIEAGHDMIDNAEEIIQEGKEAFEILVSNHYNLARKIAHRHHKRTGTRYAIDDLLQDAITALCEATYTYDPAMDCRLSTHAYYRITKEVTTSINKQRLVRLPENRMGQYSDILKLKDEYQSLVTEGKVNGITELQYIYDNADISREDIDIILNNMTPTVSLNATIADSDSEVGDYIESNETYYDVDDVELSDLDTNLLTILEQLSPMERDLVAYEYGAFPASMEYSDFLVKYDMTDRKVKLATTRTLRKMRKIAEGVI